MCCALSSNFFWTSGFCGRTGRGHSGWRVTQDFSTFLLRCLPTFFLASRIQAFLSLVDREVEFCVLNGRLLCIRKTYTKMDQIRFFRLFSILWVREWSKFVWPNPFELFVTGLQTDLVPKSVCSSDTNLQTDFARGATITTFAQ